MIAENGGGCRPSRNGIGLFVPASFDPAATVAWNRGDHARYVAATILRKSVTSDDASTALSASVLRCVLGPSYHRTVIRPMLDAGLLTRTPFNRSQAKSFRYRLNDRFGQDDIAWHSINSPDLRGRLAKHYAQRLEQSQANWCEVHHALREMQSQLRIDRLAALATINRLQPRAGSKVVNRLGQRLLVESIRARRGTFVVDRFGRVHNAITSLRRELRHHLTIEGQNLVSVDVRNSQPLLLGALMLGSIRLPSVSRVQNPSSDIKLFVELTARGRLYEFLGNETGLSREDVKHQFLTDVLAKRAGYARQARHGCQTVEHCMRERFGSVRAFIHKVNLKDHGTLIRHLQRAESELVIKGVARWIASNHADIPALTLHDAVFVQSSNSEKLIEAFKRVAAENGIRLSTEIKFYGTDTTHPPQVT